MSSGIPLASILAGKGAPAWRENSLEAFGWFIIPAMEGLDVCPSLSHAALDDADRDT